MGERWRDVWCLVWRCDNITPRVMTASAFVTAPCEAKCVPQCKEGAVNAGQGGSVVVNQSKVTTWLSWKRKERPNEGP